MDNTKSHSSPQLQKEDVVSDYGTINDGSSPSNPATTRYVLSSFSNRIIHPTTDNSAHDDDQLYDIDDDNGHFVARERLLSRARQFQLAHDPHRGYRATEVKCCSCARPHMRAMHASWLLFFASYFVQFGMAPLLPLIQTSLQITKQDIWWTNIWMMVGGIPMRFFIVGPLCEKVGGRTLMTGLLALSSIPCMLSGLIIHNRSTLTWIRFWMGAMDNFVPGQVWITCHFVREVGGTAMAISSGLGASGSAATQLVVGSVIFPVLCLYVDENMAWRWALVVPAILALIIAWIFYVYSDDSPLGNYRELLNAGLMMERSAVDSFRAGTLNLNSWILCLQYAASCGVDVTMCNGTVLYYHFRYDQSIAEASAAACLYGVSALFARGVGGYLSDVCGTKGSLRGRLWIQMIVMTCQGVLNICFARTATLSTSLIIMVVFSIFVQMSMGTCFGIVPYVDSPNTGAVAGIVGAGGNIGAVFLGSLFMALDYPSAMESMGWWTLLAALLTPLIVIKGYKGIVFGSDADRDCPSRQQHSPLLTPAAGKLHHSPHLVTMNQTQQQTHSRNGKKKKRSRHDAAIDYL